MGADAEDFPGVTNNFNYNKYVYEEQSEEFVKTLDALAKSVAVLTVTVAEQTVKIDQQTEQINALTLGVYSLAQSTNTLEDNVAADLSALTREVEENKSVTESAIQLLHNLAEEVRAAATDQAALSALAATLDSSGQALADAIAANTPQGPPPVETPPNPDDTPHPDHTLPGDLPPDQ